MLDRDRIIGRLSEDLGDDFVREHRATVASAIAIALNITTQCGFAVAAEILTIQEDSEADICLSMREFVQTQTLLPGMGTQFTSFARRYNERHRIFHAVIKAVADELGDAAEV